MRQQITPYLLYEDGEAAVEFVTNAFGFREVERGTGGAGGLHVELEEPGGGRIYLGSPPSGFENPATVGRTSLLYVIVDDLDTHYERAKAAGAEIVEEPADQPYGDRRYGCRDPQGHEWFFAQVLAGRR
jgi:PhnB protein